ncbi:threonine aspartase [Nesidiocoris tenuis]|uniref:Threonine aspartase n=1 Tax=Nesidiocoris tenuis TaxID=355587 RepID=A0ABN7ANY1_9HEMI|nr:threonine aspartase [Nesidiocoris tenuis]
MKGPVESDEGQPSAPIFTVEGYRETSGGGAAKKARTSNCLIEEERKLDTVGAVTVDLSGETAASCSSGGILVKLPGRVGQAGVVGAGCWAEGPVAVTVSGNGEDLIRTSLCKEVARAIMASNDLASTLVQTITKLFLESKYLTTGSSKLCGVLAVKKDPEGGGELVWAHTTQSMAVGYVATNLSSPKFQISQLPKSVVPGSAVNVQGMSW